MAYTVSDYNADTDSTDQLPEYLPGRIGDIVLVLGKRTPAGTIPYGTGAEYPIDEYRDLFSWAQENCKFTDEDTWQREVAETGGSSRWTAGTTTFRMPLMDIGGILYGTADTSNGTGPDSDSSAGTSDYNLSLGIRYTTGSQFTAAGPDLAAAYKAVDKLVNTIAGIKTAYNVSANLEPVGWQVYGNGLVRLWGKTAEAQVSGNIAFPLALADVPYSLQTSVVKGTGNVNIPDVTSGGFTYTLDGTLSEDGYIMWTALGRNV